jgi:hypothetical protein
LSVLSSEILGDYQGERVMQPRLLFGLIIRIAGLTCLVFALLYVTYEIAKLLGLPARPTDSAGADIYGALTYFALGMVGFFRAEWLVRLSYGRDNNEIPPSM